MRPRTCCIFPLIIALCGCASNAVTELRDNTFKSSGMGSLACMPFVKGRECLDAVSDEAAFLDCRFSSFRHTPEFYAPGALPEGTPGLEPMYVDPEGNIVPIGQTPPAGSERLYYPDDKANPTPRNWHRWDTSVVVYEWENCDNPNTTIKIVGYSRIEMTDVLNAPEKRVVGKILCDQFSNFDTRGGGGDFGVKGTIPGLVE